MKKVFALTFLASFIATPVLAGETFVRNEWTNRNSVTKTNLNLDSTTNSYRNEDYVSAAEKFYYEGGKKKQDGKNYSGKYKPKKDYASGYTEHYAGSLLVGNFNEHSYSHVYGTINTHTNEHSNAHETTSGIR
ncbi:MAG: hypothetical protein AAF349_13810 [Cyanobacteria bacterium P01_A01_bin.68]